MVMEFPLWQFMHTQSDQMNALLHINIFSVTIRVRSVATAIYAERYSKPMCLAVMLVRCRSG